MEFDYSRLRGAIRENGKTQEEVSAEAALASATFSQKLNNKGLFRQNEITAICDCLHIPYSKISEYFFTLKV